MAERDSHRGKDKTEGDVGVITRTEEKTQTPSMFKVILMNDDFTPMEFVVHVLMKFFRKSEQEALRLMLQVHQAGSSVVGIYSREIAETKTQQVNEYSKKHEFPLLCKFEKE